MRFFVILGLLLAFASPLITKSILLCDYYTDYSDYLVHCKNKAKPELQCNGKCQLAKEFQKIETGNPEKPELPQSIVHQEFIILEPISLFVFVLLNMKEENKVFHYQNNYTLQHPCDDWNPPRSSSYL